jgi:hypothetical protein
VVTPLTKVRYRPHTRSKRHSLNTVSTIRALDCVSDWSVYLSNGEPVVLLDGPIRNYKVTIFIAGTGTSFRLLECNRKTYVSFKVLLSSENMRNY